MMIRPYKNILPTLAKNVFIAENAVVIGDVHIGAESNVWFGCIIRGDVNHIRIGERTNIQDGTRRACDAENRPYDHRKWRNHRA